MTTLAAIVRKALCGGVLCAGLTLVTGPVQAERIEVTHYKTQYFGAPYTVAAKQGYFRDAGLEEVELLGSSGGGGTSVRNLMASGAIYAEVALQAAVSAIQAGVPIKIVSPGTNGHNSLWVTRPDMTIDGPKDLKGKRIAYTTPGSVTEGLVRSFLEATGLGEGDVKAVSLGAVGAGLTALEQGKVDIAILPEPLLSQRMAMTPPPDKPLPWLNALVPTFTQSVGIAPTSAIETEPKKVQAIVDARRKGVEFLYANPAEAARMLSDVNGLSPADNERAIAGLRKLSDRWWVTGAFDFAAMDASLSVMRRAGAMSGDIDWKSMIDDRFVSSKN